jgi:hypothetical protein
MFLVLWAVWSFKFSVSLTNFESISRRDSPALPHCWGSSLSENSAWALSHGHQYFGQWSKSPVKASRYRIRFRSSPVRVCGSQAPSMENWRHQCAGGFDEFSEPCVRMRTAQPPTIASSHCSMLDRCSDISDLTAHRKGQSAVSGFEYCGNNRSSGVKAGSSDNTAQITL